jgi:ERF superfamily
MATQSQPLSSETQNLVHHLGPKPLSAIDLLTLALENNAAIDVIERLAKLQHEERAYQATVEFDLALNRCQEKLRPIAADASNSQTNSRYASYAQLDRVVRPIYTAEGFALSFGEADCPTPGKTRFVACLSRAGVTRETFKDLSPSTKGPKGGDVMTPIHADASADSYAKRYLLKNIFNIAIGDDDNDGNGNGSEAVHIPQTRIDELCRRIANAKDMQGLFDSYSAAANEVKKNAPYDRAALGQIIRAKEVQKKELAKGGLR